MILLATIASVLFFPQPTAAQGEPSPSVDWQAAESPRLSNATQLTFGDRFTRAGEAYFSPDESKIVFQAIEVPAPGSEPSPFYAMFVADLVSTDSRPSLANIRRVSPDGSANTCGWFDQSDPTRLLFASTVVPPTDEETPGYQRGSGRYRWAFPREMRVVSVPLDGSMALPPTAASLTSVVGDGQGYVAEGSLSPDGRWLAYCRMADGDANLHVLDRSTGKDLPLVTARGYDGGPFFSPCGKRICYRSDREGNDLLQLFVADLAFDATGAITGVARERQLTRDDSVNWAPFWTPDGAFLVYATSREGHQNYEVFAVPVPAFDATPAASGAVPTPVRITHAAGADVLPVVSKSGRRLLWTSKRAADGTAQLWIADFVPLTPGSPPAP